MAAETPSLTAVHSTPTGYPAALVAGHAANLLLFIDGKPVPKGRPRSRITNGARPYVHVYTPPTTATWETHIETCVRTQIRELNCRDLVLPFAGRVLMDVRFNFRRPKSTPLTVLWPTKSRSDVDNLVKAILDAVQNAGVMVNDCLVTDLNIRKRFADQDHPEGVEVDVTGIM